MSSSFVCHQVAESFLRQSVPLLVGLDLHDLAVLDSFLDEDFWAEMSVEGFRDQTSVLIVLSSLRKLVSVIGQLLLKRLDLGRVAGAPVHHDLLLLIGTELAVEESVEDADLAVEPLPVEIAARVKFSARSNI